MRFDWKARIRNKAFWVAIFAIIAITGQVFGTYKVPVGWDSWVNAVLVLLTTAGIIIDTSTPGISDK